MIVQFPKDCTLIECSEEQQTFFTNSVRNREPEKRINVNGLLIVHACNDYNTVFMIIDYVENTLSKNHPNHALPIKSLHKLWH